METEYPCVLQSHPHPRPTRPQAAVLRRRKKHIAPGENITASLAFALMVARSSDSLLRSPPGPTRYNLNGVTARTRRREWTPNVWYTPRPARDVVGLDEAG